MKRYWEIIADNLSKAGAWAGSQLSTLKDEPSGLLTRIATMESDSLCVRIKKLMAFVEPQSAIRDAKTPQDCGDAS